MLILPLCAAFTPALPFDGADDPAFGPCGMVGLVAALVEGDNAELGGGKLDVMLEVVERALVDGGGLLDSGMRCWTRGTLMLG